MHCLYRTFSRIILGAAVIDDILAMLLLGVVSAIQSGGTIDVTYLLIVLGQTIAFIILIIWAGTHIMLRSSPILDAPINSCSALTLSLVLCLALASLLHRYWRSFSLKKVVNLDWSNSTRNLVSEN
ncbi:hypothetical protein [Methylobacter sp. YRD-M1]|uniref:hypothetical protein n=1 Tax=Methylobacter sp. YRD-M1 TaxID=2911520 RepID=UPI00227B7613|nr:hypothetical protein [Methylobacter sp. YRD-M1]WAK04072.1 hypothetical protein LZ558_09875 [Methylobacter sp. YRD-M1]